MNTLPDARPAQRLIGSNRAPGGCSGGWTHEMGDPQPARIDDDIREFAEGPIDARHRQSKSKASRKI